MSEKLNYKLSYDGTDGSILISDHTGIEKGLTTKQIVDSYNLLINEYNSLVGMLDEFDKYRDEMVSLQLYRSRIMDFARGCASRGCDRIKD